VDHLRDSVVLNYRLVEKLGEGGFGAVFRARHEDLGREVAIKVLRSDRASHPGVVERFLREARIICDIGHPAIVEIENAGRLPTGEPFYVMELVPGQSLAQRLTSRGPLSPRDAIAVFTPLAEALDAAHAKGIVHRDIKPHNVMVVERDGVIVAARLLDFGIAKLLAAGDASSTGEVMGSPHFMAPEQALDSKRATHAADVYSFGATLFNALTGRRPFDGNSVPAVLLAVQQMPAPRLSQLTRAAPAALDDLLDRCLAKEPEARPASILEAWAGLRAGLAAVADLQLVPGASDSPDVYTRTATAGSTSAASMGEVSLTPPRQPPRRPRRLGWVLGGLAVALAGGAIAVVAASGAGSDSRRADTLAATTHDATAMTDAERVIDPSPPSPSPLDAPTPPPDAADTADDPPTATPIDAGARARTRRNPGASSTPAPRTDSARTVPPPAIRCERPTFAEVYQAAYPTPEQVRSALNRLRACKARGLISESDYTSIQSALVARL
jgi:serine/threonine-protein kinase